MVWVGRRFGNGGSLEAAFALTECCSRPRYRAAAELEALGTTTGEDWTLGACTVRDGDKNERYVVNIGGRSKRHYEEAWPIAQAAAKAVARAKQFLDPSTEVLGKNGGLEGCMAAFGDAYTARGLPWIPVLTRELDCPGYAPEVSRENPRKIIETSNTQRLETIVKHPHNKLVIVTTGGSGTFEELAASLCEIEWRVKWPAEAQAEPFCILIAGDAAVRMWRPVLQAVFCQVTDTHPTVERHLVYIPTEYVESGFFGEEVHRALMEGHGA